ncbi:hypothetical protein [Gluconobacter cerinus]|uniref:hypothetical protein n=1 Tax=Gluconobacter cerinus TaxID=38307 RepID=UPI001C05764A|nr:hypothetical protein [Gluconobacter cerinus]
MTEYSENNFSDLSDEETDFVSGASMMEGIGIGMTIGAEGGPAGALAGGIIGAAVGYFF